MDNVMDVNSDFKDLGVDTHRRLNEELMRYLKDTSSWKNGMSEFVTLSDLKIDLSEEDKIHASEILEALQNRVVIPNSDAAKEDTEFEIAEMVNNLIK